VEQIISAQDARNRAQERERLIKAACIPHERYMVWDAAKAAETGSTEILPWISARKNESLWIPGAHGIGKTHSAVYAAYRRLLQTGQECYIIEALVWSGRWMADRYSNDKLREAKADAAERRACTEPHLVIDDIGADLEKQASPERVKLYQRIINDRERAGRLTWVTTNLSADALLAILGKRTRERLRRMITKNNIYGLED